MPLESLLAGVLLCTLVAYSVLAGADFGAGVWDLLSRGPRRAAERRAIAEAIGPVWEANHVWLIFLIVLLFTCFPSVYAAASIALFWPLHFVLIGIVLRGAAFVFRAHGAPTAAAQAAWGRIFGAASAVTPMLLGMCLGAVSTGGIRVYGGAVSGESRSAWLGVFPAMTGLLALLLSAYLAAVYLAWESDRELQKDFHRRAMLTWLAAGAVSVATLLIAREEAPRLWERLTSTPANALLLSGALLAPASLFSLWRRRFGVARVLGAAQVVVLLAGWGAAQWPYLIFPDFTIAATAAPRSTLSLTAATLPFGLAALIPSLWFLFAVFKGHNLQAAHSEGGPERGPAGRT
jgi:cytochrome d ubiquinol oxidase subunit II